MFLKSHVIHSQAQSWQNVFRRHSYRVHNGLEILARGAAAAAASEPASQPRLFDYAETMCCICWASLLHIRLKEWKVIESILDYGFAVLRLVFPCFFFLMKSL